MPENKSPSNDLPLGDLETLLDIMRRLRDRDHGCPWDLEQDFASIAPYTIEEAYEVADAIQQGDLSSLKDELGDLLFQVVFHAQIAAEQNSFDFADVVAAISDKMIRRHPHVFGDGDIGSADAQTLAWEEMKAKERAAKGHTSLLDDVPIGLPGLPRATKLQKRAAKVGFDWPDATHVLEKITEECAELSEAAQAQDQEHTEEEFGDLLFAMANLARHLRVDPERALRVANDKFTKRFQYIEAHYQDTADDIKDASLDEMDALWVEAKKNLANAT